MNSVYAFHSHGIPIGPMGIPVSCTPLLRSDTAIVGHINRAYYSRNLLTESIASLTRSVFCRSNQSFSRFAFHNATTHSIHFCRIACACNCPFVML